MSLRESLVSADWRESTDLPTVQVNVNNKGHQRTVLVDIELHDSSGNQLAQQFYDHQHFATGQTRQFTGPTPPQIPPGTYTVQVGIFVPPANPGGQWGATLSWNTVATYTI